MILRSKTLLVIIFSPPEIGHACLLSDANDFYIEQGVHFTMKNTFRRERPPGWKCIEMTFGKRFSLTNRRFNLEHEFRTHSLLHMLLQKLQQHKKCTTA